MGPVPEEERPDALPLKPGAAGFAVDEHVVFAGILCLQYFMSFDYAIFPASFLHLQKDLGLTDFEMGVAGSLVFSGLMISTFVSAPLLVRWPQWIASSSIFLCAVAGFLCAYAPDKHTLYFARFLVGLFHGPCFIFFPVWVEAFAPAGVETRWMGHFQVMGPIANVSGYAIPAGVHAALGLSWRDVYALLGGGYLLAAFTARAIPARFFALSGQGRSEGLWASEGAAGTASKAT